MWTRAELKLRAKATLKGHYWTAFLASLVLLFAGGTGNASGGFDLEQAFGGQLEQRLQDPQFLIGFIVGILLAVAASLLFAIFVSSVLEVGVQRYFTSACCRQYSLSNLGFACGKGRYWNVVKVQLLRGVKIFLWTLLLIIPGIVKGYAYAMVPYILADNPYLSPKRAIQLSCQMTQGHKLEMFALELSFFGWYLLGALCCGVGMLFVQPYRNSTFAELYMHLRHNALQNGLTTMEELCLARN